MTNTTHNSLYTKSVNPFVLFIPGFVLGGLQDQCNQKIFTTGLFFKMKETFPLD